MVHLRPVLIQELEWQAQPTGSSSSTESPKDLVFSFYNGELFRILIKYARYETEGLTTDDMVEVVSRSYGVAVLQTPTTKATQGRYGEEDEVERIAAECEVERVKLEKARFANKPKFRP